MTGRGFWLVEAESRKTSGRPCTSVSRIGKSRRITSGSRRPLRMRPPKVGSSAVSRPSGLRGIAAAIDVASEVVGASVMAIGRSTALAGGLHRLLGVVRVLGVGAAELRTLGHEERLVGNVGRQAGLAEDRAVALLLESQRQVL